MGRWSLVALGLALALPACGTEDAAASKDASGDATLDVSAVDVVGDTALPLDTTVSDGDSSSATADIAMDAAEDVPKPMDVPSSDGADAPDGHEPTDAIVDTSPPDTGPELPECTSDTGCDDGNPCTAGTCVAGSCAFTWVSCDDGDSCTADLCEAETGCTFPPLSCDDGSLCTTEACQPKLGCVYDPVSCDDGDACTEDSCHPTAGCLHAGSKCDDGDACTIDACDPASGKCSHSPSPDSACCNDDGMCDDGTACTIDTCSDAGSCKHATITCEDGDLCTTDTCDTQTGCAHALAECDDGNDCTKDGCNQIYGCTNAPLDCDDGSLCTQDGCNPAAGCFHVPKSCADADPCTKDDCDKQTGECLNIDDGCDDGDACTLDACAGADGCKHAPTGDPMCCNTPADCGDGDACTQDLCTANLCEHPPVKDPLCCNDVSDCEPDNACATATCFEGKCTYDVKETDGCCTSAKDCDDASTCTLDACKSFMCSHIETCCASDAECDDGDDLCTTDACVFGKCSFQATGAEGCCQPDVYTESFDDGVADGFTITNALATGWTLYGGSQTTLSTALYYGDPTKGSYDFGASNGSATTPAFFVPQGVETTASFALYMDTETSSYYDTLAVYAVTDQGEATLFSKDTDLVDVKVWATYAINISAFGGTTIQLRFAFDTGDGAANTGEGVFVDDIAVTSTCAPLGCVTSSDCEDGLSTTEDTCTQGTCVHAPPAVGCTSGSPTACDDGNPCSIDSCVGSVCKHTNIAGCCISALDCKDGDPCTKDICQGGVPGGCEHVPLETCCKDAADCDDQDACTIDVCSAGECGHAPEPSCCVPVALSAPFDDGTTGGFATLTDNAPDDGVGWQLDPTWSHSPPASLYAGNPAMKSYDTGGTVSLTTASEPFTVPPFSPVLSLWLYVANEYSEGAALTPAKDVVSVLVVGDDDQETLLWTSAESPTPWWGVGAGGEVVGPKWTQISGLSLADLVGTNVRILLRFETLDATENDFPGVWIDDLTVTSPCQ